MSVVGIANQVSSSPPMMKENVLSVCIAKFPIPEHVPVRKAMGEL